MFLKTLGVLAPLGLALGYFTGVFSAAYSRDIEQPLPTVRAALANADLRQQPGSPGTDSDRSGGVTPIFRTETTDNSVVWTVMSGDKVAVTMTAALEPIHEGRGTRVIGTVVRGNADPDLVSPAFRSTGISKGLFAGMLESELGELTAAKSRQANGSGVPQHTLGDGIRTVMKVNAMHGEYLRTGKDPLADEETRLRMALEANGDSRGGDDGFKSVNTRMSGAGQQTTPGVSFEPGKPMIDLSK